MSEEIDNVVVLHEDPSPEGVLVTRVAPTPADIGASGDVEGSWLLAQLEAAASIAARQLSRGEVVMAAIGETSFLAPIAANATLSLFSTLLEAEDSELRIAVEAWQQVPDEDRSKVTNSVITYFAVDDSGEPRLLPPISHQSELSGQDSNS